MAMAGGVCLGFLVLLLRSNFSAALQEDQVGLADWHQKYIGEVKQAVFPIQKTGRKHVVVSTEENVIASLDLRSEDICELKYISHSLLSVLKQLRTGNYAINRFFANHLSGHAYIRPPLPVEGRRGIATFPAKLESTTLVFS